MNQRLFGGGGGRLLVAAGGGGGSLNLGFSTIFSSATSAYLVSYGVF